MASGWHAMRRGAKMRGTGMARGQRSVLREGVIAGVVGAAVVALWFLVFDIARGRPFLTPSLLGAAVFYGARAPEGVAVAAGPILGYTLLHVCAFVAFGVVASSVIAVSEREPALFIAFVILFAAFEMFFFAVVAALGQSMLGAIVWWAILVGNLLASVAMLGYFFRMHRALPASLVGSWGSVMQEGVTAGVLGATAVAVWFLAVDWIQGEPLRTPIVLGMTFLRQSSPSAAVFLYTLIHVLAFVVFGLVAALLLAGAEREPMLVFFVVLLFTAFEVAFFGAIFVVARWVLDELAGWTIFVGNLLAASVMLAYFFKGHRTLAHRLTAVWADED
jgi:hypothetical protein